MISNITPTDRIVLDLEMYQIERNKEKIDTMRHEIAEKYGLPIGNVVVNFIPITVDRNGERITLTSDVIDNIQDTGFIISLFDEYMKSKEIKNVDIEDIKKIDSQVNAFIDFNQYTKYKPYRFKYVKWKNYLSYGDDNFFDFTKLRGLVLLNGQPENQCGKTTFAIDLLRFALFGKAEKSPTLDSVFNVYLPEETEVIVEACLEIEGVDYVIRRTVTRPALKKRTAKSKCKQSVEYFRMINGDYELMENCEGENVQQTNNIIKESVGSVDDYNMVISATSLTLGNLLHLGQTDRGKIFSKWLGLLTIEKKEEIARKLWKENYSTKLVSNTYSRNEVELDIENQKAKIEENNRLIKSFESKITESGNKIIDLNNKKIELLKTRRNIKGELSNTDVTTIESSITSLNEQLSTKRADFSSLKEEYAKLKDITFEQAELDDVNKEIESKTKESHSIDISNAELRAKYDNLSKENNRIQKLIDGKVCPTCGQQIDISLQSSETEKNIDTMKKLVENGKQNNMNKQDLAKEIEKLNDKKSSIIERQEKVRERGNLELKLSAMKTKIENIKLQISGLEKTKSEIEENKDNIKFNNEIDNKVRTIDESIRVETGIKDSSIADKQKAVSDNNLCESKIKSNKEIMAKLTEEEVIIRNWSLYQEMVGKNGVIKIILRKALPVINNEVDRILYGLTDFKVVLDVNEKNEITIDMIRDGKPLDMSIAASGFESTFTSLALRSALSRIGTMPKSNFLVLDEVDSTIASSNYDNLKELYHRILSGYDFIIHIVHNELLSDMHDMTISVQKHGNVSKIITC